jgi:hypothetical protein
MESDHTIGSGGADFDYDPYNPDTGEWFNPEVGPTDPPAQLTGYRGHALRRIQLRGITRGEVEEFFDNPPQDPIWQPAAGTWKYVNGPGGLGVAVNLQGKIVSSW